MSLLGDVRNMIAHAPIHDREVSVRRECRLGTGCPLLGMPRIVAALEAAERVVTAFEDDAVEDPDVLEAIRPLVAALKGAEAP